MNQLDEKDREFISRKKTIEYNYAQPYMPPCANSQFESEPELRSRVREGLQYLDGEERADMQQDLHRAYYSIFTPEYYSSPNMGLESFKHG